jgi:steroid delta-isomerase-like uncharacterized protein
MSKQNVDAFREMLAFWNRHDTLGAADLMTEDVDYWDVTMPKFVKGRDEVRKIFQSFFDAFPDLEFEIKNIFGCGENVACEWRMRGTQRKELQGIDGIGKSIDIVEISFCTFRDGKICRQIDSWDSGTFLRQLGISS